MTATEYFRPRKIRHLTRAHAEEYAAFVLNQANPIIHYNSDTMKRRDEYDREGSEMSVPIVMEIVARRFRITPEEITIKSRKRDYKDPRQICHMICRKVLGLKLDRVAFIIGSMDHATVLHSCRTVSNLYSSDRAYRNRLNMIAEECGIGEERIRMVLAERSERWHP